MRFADGISQDNIREMVGRAKLKAEDRIMTALQKYMRENM